MSKITLASFSNLNNASAITDLNNNNTVITAAVDNSLSRDGTQPNQMLSDLDMNAHYIFNLPKAVASSQAVRKQEFDDLVLSATNITVQQVVDAIIAQITPGSGLRKLLTANTNFYITTTGSDSTGDGSLSKPWASLQHAANVLQQQYDFGGHAAIVNVADGTYIGGVHISGPMVGQLNFAGLQFVGNTTTPANCIIKGRMSTMEYNFAADSGASYTINGFYLQRDQIDPTNALGQDMVTCGAYSLIALQNIIFGDSVGQWNDMSCFDYGQIYVLGNYEIKKSGFAVTANTPGTASNVLTGVSDFTNVYIGQGVTGAGVDNFSFISAFNSGAGTITLNKNCTGASATGTSLLLSMGGQCHIDIGGYGSVFYQNNGDPTVCKVTFTGTGIPMYGSGTILVNGGHCTALGVNWQYAGSGGTFPGPNNPAVDIRSGGVMDSNNEGVGGFQAFPGTFFATDSGAASANTTSIVITGSTTNFQAGNFVNGYVDTTASITTGSRDVTITGTLTNIDFSANKLTGAGIPSGADIAATSGVSGAFVITLTAACTATGSIPIRVTGTCVPNGTYITSRQGNTLNLSKPIRTNSTGSISLAGGCLQRGNGVWQ